MSTKGRWYRGVVVAGIVVALVFSVRPVTADDLTGSKRFLCVPVQARVCVEDGECAVELLWNVNIPQFIEVDLDAGRLSSTAASGENRTTPIEHLNRVDGAIVFHGFEMGRAFSVCLEAKKYMVRY